MAGMVNNSWGNVFEEENLNWISLSSDAGGISVIEGFTQ